MAVGPDWLRAKMPTLFPSAAEPVDRDGEPALARQRHAVRPSGPAAAAPLAAPAPSRGVGYTSGALPSFDEQTLSQIINPMRSKKVRAWLLLLLAMMIGAVVILWMRY